VKIERTVAHEDAPRLTIRPITVKEAQAFVRQYHRHHKPPCGCRFALAVVDAEGAWHGVAMANRPVSRVLDDGLTLEVSRCCTDGTPNACSKLYGAVRRVAQAMGYRKVVTYTLPEEGGASLRGAGYQQMALIKGHSWHTPTQGRNRTDDHPQGDKWRWEVTLKAGAA
jgi:hypothetical protein